MLNYVSAKFQRNFRHSPAPLFVLIIGLCAAFSPALAQEYPSRPIRLLVGYPAGGGVDITARMVAAELQKILGQSIVVENRAGAGGGVAADMAARAPNDGYTLLMGNTSSLAITPFVYPKTYDPLKDFLPVVLVSSIPMVLVTHPASKIRNLYELVSLAKRKPGAISFGTGGQGSIGHLTMEVLKVQTGVDLLHVPYKGGTPAITDLMGKQLDLVVEGINVVAPYVKSGKLSVVAVASKARSNALPDAPTSAESGHAAFVATAWFGVVAPAGTPRAITEKLNSAINTLLREPSVRESLAKQGADPVGGTASEFAELLRNDTAMWAGAVKTSGVKVE